MAAKTSSKIKEKINTVPAVGAASAVEAAAWFRNRHCTGPGVMEEVSSWAARSQPGGDTSENSADCGQASIAKVASYPFTP